jgi:mRNA interferase MazF
LPLSSIAGLADNSMVLLEQLRTIDKRRLGRYVGCLGYSAMRMVDAALAISLALHDKSANSMVMTLCRSCKIAFEDSGYAVRLLSRLNDAKATCDFCNHRCGFDYELERM